MRESFCLIFLFALSGLVQAQVRVVAAADLQYALQEMAKRYEARTGTKAEIIFGSSGKLYAQLKQGLQADLYFSANEEYPFLLEKEGFTEPGYTKPYALGRLALFVPANLVASGLDPEGRGVDTLRDARVKRIAIANPAYAPYGRAAVSFFQSYGLIKPKDPLPPWEGMNEGIPRYFDLLFPQKVTFVYGGNISQTAQFALTGADAGIIALAIAILLAREGKGKHWTIPADKHIPLRQVVAILKGRARPEVVGFYQFAFSKEGVEILEKYGFDRP